jgi:hypothetical protein
MNVTPDKVIEVFLAEYEKAKDNPTVFKPCAYAAYKAWRFADSRERKRCKEYER